MSDTSEPAVDHREAFENQVLNALSAAMRATTALWDIYRSLEIENNGGSVSWDRIEENVWEANEAAGFLETYVKDETGVVAQYRKIEAGRLDVPQEIAEYPPAQLLKHIQDLAEHPESSMTSADVATAATNIADPDEIAHLANQSEDGPVLRALTTDADGVGESND